MNLYPMSKLMRDVILFHEACDVPIHHSPVIPPAERIKLRRMLLDEESSETSEAMFELEQILDETLQATPDRIDVLMAEVADGLADTIYVAIGAALEFGIPLTEVWSRVQAANMAKVDANTGKVRRREDGKVLKPDGWKEPDILGALKDAGWRRAVI